MAVDERTQKGSGVNKKGFALILVLGFAAVLAVFTASIGAQAAFNLRVVEQRGQIDTAHYASTSGVQMALSLLREPPASNLAWLQNDATIGFFFEETKAESLAHVYHNIVGYNGGTTQAPDGTIIPPDHFYIVSMGVVNGVYDANGDLQSGVTQETTLMGSTLVPKFPVMPHAAFGFDSLTINGTTDHYDSRTSSGHPIFYAGGGTGPMTCSQPEASVATDSVDQDDVTIGASAEIDGHLLLGVSATSGEIGAMAAKVGGSSHVTPLGIPNYGGPGGGSGPGTSVAGSRVNGHVGRASSRIHFPPIDPVSASAETPLPGGGTRTLDEGETYYQSGSLLLSGTDDIVIQDTNLDGRVEDVLIIVESDIEFSNLTGLNDGLPPRRLKMISLGQGGGSPATFRMRNGSRAYCLVSGTNLNVEIGGASELWGAVIGSEVLLDGKIHYDVALRDPAVIADIYDFTIDGTVVSAQASVPTSVLTSPATTGAAPAPAATTPAAAASGSSCGCGCGGGSMLLALK